MDGAPHPTRVALRSPETVMRLSRMGSFHPMRLSFMRILLRRIKAEGWAVSRPVWEIDARGVGRAVYTATGPERSYSLVVFAHDLPDHLRSDRVIAEAWDATFALYDGVPSAEDLDRLNGNVPVQEAGRMSIRELTLSRANRSVRLFAHVIDALAAGRQPDPEEIAKVGYLMRTTAVYGSAKFGLSDREVYCHRPELSAPFQAEMLTVWLIRAFSVDIVEHLAQVKGGETAVRMDPDIRRGLGIGNSTGLGMAPFLLTHPVLINNWITARETALARVRALASFSEAAWATFRTALAAAIENLNGWRTEHPIQIEKLGSLGKDLDALDRHVKTFRADMDQPGERLWSWGEDNLGEEGQEQLLSLLLEPFAEEVDDLAETLSANEQDAFAIDASGTVGTLTARIDELYRWATTKDWSADPETARLWYVSEEKLEPRLAERADEPLEPYEQPLAPACAIAALRDALGPVDGTLRISDFLSEHPHHRDAVRRVQIASAHPYAEVRDNTISAEMLPIDLLRAKLSFFGATRFDPRSDRWVRITMFNNAPFPDEIAGMDSDSWMFGPSGATDCGAPGPVAGICTSSLPDQSQPCGSGWSVGEIRALSIKAARGAGLPWGIAAEAGQAVGVLSRLGLPGAEALVADLTGDDPGGTLLLGCEIADSANPMRLETFDRPVVPVLLAPFLRAALKEHEGLTVHDSRNRELLRVSKTGCALVSDQALSTQPIRVSPAEPCPPVPPRQRVETIAPQTLANLQALAHKTYAPASELSRLKGAGAGIVDND